MGFLDFLKGFRRITCPLCGTPDAIRTRSGEIRCKNPSCAEFDADWALKGKASPAGKRTTIPTEGDFRPSNPIGIRYRNFAGQERTFQLDVDSIERKGNHLSGRAAPTGQRIALSRDRIPNLAEIEAQLSPQIARPQPTGRERQVLAYHLKHHSTSPLFEKIRRKYPDWRSPNRVDR